MAFGRLFTQDFLEKGIHRTDDWKSLQSDLPALRKQIVKVFDDFPVDGNPEEAETETRLIYKITDILGWKARSVQQAVERGRREIPDALLFLNQADQAKADQISGPAKHKHADVILEAKRWDLALDKAGGRESPPSAQLLNYLSRAEVQSDGRIRWGILTNGSIWRLYWRGAKSLLTDYFEIDLAAAVGAKEAEDLFAARSDEEKQHDLTLFLLFFSKAAFDPSERTPAATFHEIALEEGRFWEARVTRQLRSVVFDTVYPGFIRALKKADCEAPSDLTDEYLAELRESTFTFLYRLLFTLYAEDRDLLPKSDEKYDDYSLSKQVRDEIARQIDESDTLSTRASRLYNACKLTFKLINEGDASVGVPPYNGGLFSDDRAPLLNRVEIPDADLAPLIDALSRTEKDGQRVRVSYRDLSVRELGSIYERLLEYEAIADQDEPDGIAIRLNPFARKGSGSYYTPDELVNLIIEETLDPLVEERIAEFESKAAEYKADKRPLSVKVPELTKWDPATKLLELKVCDPAMGSGHFLVALVDYLSEKVFDATEKAYQAVAAWGNADAAYHSPLLARAEEIRSQVWDHAREEGWTIRPGHVSDEAIVRRMVLKRCVYGVDKNPMAVELAKVGLWLHTLTAGAPLSFLDHHLRCGDSLFGEKVRSVRDTVGAKGALFLTSPLRAAEGAVKYLAWIENLTDADMDEARQSAEYFDSLREKIDPLNGFFSFIHALKWVDLDAAEKRALDALLDTQFGDPLEVASGILPPQPPKGVDLEQIELLEEAPPEDQPALLPEAAPASLKDWLAIRQVLQKTHALIAEERFLHWELAFPGVWSDWSSAEPKGGFDAIVGNPPWDRMKMQEVEWFAARAPEIARQPRAADRKAAIRALEDSGDPLAKEYELARDRAARGAKLAAHKTGNYPFLGRGDVNLYSLFVERGLQLIRPSGFSGLLVPSGIASDKTASTFFKSVSTAGRVRVLFDFENRRGLDVSGRQREHFFPEVDSRFKFAAFVVSGEKRLGQRTRAGFFLKDPPQYIFGDQVFILSADDFALVNPNTGTAPIFRSKRDAEIATAIYRRLPVLVDRSGEEPVAAWPVQYKRMFDMTNDSDKFWTREALEREGAYPAGRGRWRKGEREWLPLFVGRMVHHFDHRVSSVRTNEANVHNPALSESVTSAEKSDPEFAAIPQYWVESNELKWTQKGPWALCYRDVARSTDERTLIGSLIPRTAVGNKLPLILCEDAEARFLLCGWLTSLVGDFVARQKLMSTSLNWYIVEQLPVIPREGYEHRFGDKTAAEIVKDHVLRLTYTAWDMEPFARDMGYEGDPFIWDEAERRHLRARLDALYFHLYGITDEADIRYILSNFPIVERKDRAAFEGVYLTEELIIWYFRALASGDAETDAPEAELIRMAKARES